VDYAVLVDANDSADFEDDDVRHDHVQAADELICDRSQLPQHLHCGIDGMSYVGCLPLARLGRPCAYRPCSPTSSEPRHLSSLATILPPTEVPYRLR